VKNLHLHILKFMRYVSVHPMYSYLQMIVSSKVNLKEHQALFPVVNQFRQDQYQTPSLFFYKGHFITQKVSNPISKK
jgi:hypothetical protein